MKVYHEHPIDKDRARTKCANDRRNRKQWFAIRDEIKLRHKQEVSEAYDLWLAKCARSRKG